MNSELRINLLTSLAIAILMVKPANSEFRIQQSEFH